jgi:hypothetical protein
MKPRSILHSDEASFRIRADIKQYGVLANILKGSKGCLIHSASKLNEKIAEGKENKSTRKTNKQKNVFNFPFEQLSHSNRLLSNYHSFSLVENKYPFKNRTGMQKRDLTF